MPSYLITDNDTGRKFKVTGDSPPTEAEAAQIFADMGGAKPSVGNSPETVGENQYFGFGQGSKEHRAAMADFIRKNSKRDMKQEAVRGIPVIGGRVADASMGKYNNPVYAERTVDETIGNATPDSLPAAVLSGVNRVIANPDKSLSNLAYALPELAKGGYQAATSPESGSMAKFAIDTARGIAAPTGIPDVIAGDFSMPQARQAWDADALGSALTLYGGIKGAKSSLSGMADKVTTPIATKLMDMTLKQGTKLKPGIRKKNVTTALEEGINPNAKGADKLNTIISETEGTLDAGISSGTAANVKGTLQKAKDNIDALREEANRSSDPAGNNALIDAEIARLQTSPMVDPVTGEIPVANIQKMKVEQGRELQKTYGENKPQFQNKIDKARVRGLKEELELQLDQAFPELSATNKKLSEYYNLKKSLDPAASRIENNQGIGIGAPIKAGSGATIGGMIGGPAGATIGGTIGAMIGVIEHPAVAPRLANLLYRSEKGRISRAAALALVDKRLSAIKAGYIAGLGNDNTQQGDTQ